MSEAASRPFLPAPGQRLPMVCRCCAGSNVELVLDLGDQPHCNRLVSPALPLGTEPSYPLRLGFCHACSMVQIDHTIPKEMMFSDYPYTSGTTQTLTEHFRVTASRLADAYGLGANDLVVDIGSNDGTWLKQYRPFGCRVLGVEAADNVAELANAEGIRTWNRFFNEECARDIRGEFGPAKLITAAGVFFHLEELHSVIRGIGALLAEDGVLVVQAIYLGGMLQNTAFDQIYHEHLCYYTLGSLSALLGRHGLEVVDAHLLPIHGGSIEAHVVRRGTRTVADSVLRMRADEHSRGMEHIETYRRFAEDVTGLRDRMLDLLTRYRSSGRSVWAYGAPAKGATLLNSFGIGRDLVQKAVEKNPLKIGLAIPGVRIPIEDEVGQRPDAYLVLAWNFIDEFLRKEARWLADGGQFIVPIPEVKVFPAVGS